MVTPGPRYPSIPGLDVPSKLGGGAIRPIQIEGHFANSYEWAPEDWATTLEARKPKT